MSIIRKTHPLIKIINSSLVDLPTPMNISTWWNFGSLLGMCMMIQLVTGLFLSMHYSSDISTSFNSVIYIMRDVNHGWLLRTIHANGASLFFICVYLHVGRGLYYSSFSLKETWSIGVILLFMVMGVAFMGYVLPWGQMSFWGATVITNLLSAIPYLGQMMVQWVWGGFAVDNATLNRFFSIHFTLPFMIMAFIMIHLLFLHQTGSNNPMGINSNIEKIPFHPFFSFKDIYGFIIMTWAMVMLVLLYPNMLGDTENFIPANPLMTPTHIQPEWYFLFAYAILRSIPNKLGGVIALIMSIAILIFMPLLKKNKINGMQFSPFNKTLLWTLLNLVALLTWIGACPVEPPFIITGQIMTLSYFLIFFIDSVVSKKWEHLIM